MNGGHHLDLVSDMRYVEYVNFRNERCLTAYAYCISLRKIVTSLDFGSNIYLRKKCQQTDNLHS